MEIRAYKKSDLNELERICIQTSSFPHDLDSVVLHIYLYPYIDNILVAVDEKDEPVGYLAFSSNYDSWVSNISKEIKECNNNVAFLIGKQEIDSLKAYKEQYPAHLHINIDKKYRRMGLGKMLMQEFFKLLINQNIRGVIVEVSPLNKNAIAFYKKVGFKTINMNGCVTLGIEL